MAWTAIVLVNLLIIRGNSLALAVLVNLLVYTFIAFGLSFLLQFFNKIKYPVGTVLGSLPILGLTFYVYVAFGNFIQTSIISSVTDIMLIGVVSVIPILVAMIVPLVYISYFCQDRREKEVKYEKVEA